MDVSKKSQQWIIFKADDLNYDPKYIISDGWKRFFDLVVNLEIKCSIGLIGNSLESEDEAYFQYLRDLHMTSNFEIWNHGYDHLLRKFRKIRSDWQMYSEFCNTSLGHQKSHILKTQQLAFERLQIRLATFGAPGNRIDKNTTCALDEIDEIKIWLYGDPASKKLVLKHYMRLEFPTHYPVYEEFLKHYSSKPEYLVLQGHPKGWDLERLKEFEKVVNFLKERNPIFANPSDYFRHSEK